MEEHQIFQQKSTPNTRVSNENMYSRISLANTNAIRNKCYTHITVLKTFVQSYHYHSKTRTTPPPSIFQHENYSTRFSAHAVLQIIV